MSSVCSINSCTSPGVTSSNVSSNKLSESMNIETLGGRIRTIVPDVKKDNKYWERRRRNNEAARRSREKRRVNDMNMDNRIMELSQRNKELEQELFQLKMGSTLLTSTHLETQYDVKCKKSKLTPISPATDKNKEKLQANQLNGMVFPIFTAIKPVNNNKNNSESTKPVGHLNPMSGNKVSHHNDNSRFHTNLLTLSNIPLLSNLITSSNYNEDITMKPTLLIPPFQLPSKTTDQTNLSDSPLNRTDQVGVTASLTNLKTECKDLSKNDPCNVKTEFHDILDLRIKHENGQCLISVGDVLSADFEEAIIKSEAGKDLADHINNVNLQSVEGLVKNSFLSGSVPLNYDKGSSPVSASYKKDEDNRNRPKPSTTPSGQKDFKYYRRRKKAPLDHVFNLRSRLQIRDEITYVVSKENGRLHDAIFYLSEEIKQLKSVLMSTVTNLLRTQPIRERSTCMSQGGPIVEGGP